jgi:viologen exporter family transport system permease protein
VRAYWETAVRGYRRYATYRGATFAGVFTNSVWGVMRGYVLLALVAARPHVGGYDQADAMTYVWLTQGMIMVTYIWGWNELALRVVSGDVAVDLSRPIDFQGYWLAGDLGRALFHAIFRGVPPFLLGAILFPLRIPIDPVTWLSFLASVVVATILSFSLRFMVNLTAFWLLDYRGVLNVTSLTITFLTGMIIPLNFLPEGPRAVVSALPFAGMLQVPVDVFLGKHHGLDLLGTLAFQAAWAAVLLVVGRVILAAAVRKLVVQGG